MPGQVNINVRYVSVIQFYMLLIMVSVWENNTISVSGKGKISTDVRMGDDRQWRAVRWGAGYGWNTCRVSLRMLKEITRRCIVEDGSVAATFPYSRRRDLCGQPGLLTARVAGEDTKHHAVTEVKSPVKFVISLKYFGQSHWSERHGLILIVLCLIWRFHCGIFRQDFWRQEYDDVEM